MVGRLVRILTVLLLVSAARPAVAQTVPIPVKVVVVAMFELGEDSGDRAGEFQHWVERRRLDRVLPFPQGYSDLRMNDEGVLGVVTGVGTVRAAATIMALGMDPRFDLSRAYWVIAGIAGIDAEDASLGSVAWAEWIVDGDLKHEIDAREIPSDWPTGMVPLRKSVPYESPRERGDTAQVFRLDAGLTEWAWQLTRDVPLTESPEMREERARYPEGVARRPPFVLKGDNLSSSTFWIGARLTDWANAWVRYHTDGQGNFVTSAMEDSGTLQSITWLARAGKADVRRVLVLRAGSDHDLPPPGRSAAEALARTKIGQYAAYGPAIENAYRVGAAVVDALLAGWSTYRDTPPAATRRP
ncbi:purine nucleoside permease [Luteitalea sp. TBR-22]|uniref:purine-nucleoside phosphorylase n=1 Tax=Luteitalea sp. TBR-22 TaxID=2802971 RepID=UPI001EF74D91|nr:purine nucleoside permease [Luteitalea sp. TBR-22]BCS35494.2 purine nucleoside permease [Luteitalea sp. TBR-22]